MHACFVNQTMACMSGKQPKALNNSLAPAHNNTPILQLPTRCWPSSRMSRAERERKIQEFAESQGCNAAILDAGFGTRAIPLKA